MKILVLGGDGMLGHRLLIHLGERHEVRVTLRGQLDAYAQYGLFDAANAYDLVDVRSMGRLREVAAQFAPAAIINAVGIVKQRSAANESIPSLEINSLLPHRLALLAADCGARLLHFSTDCVFSGDRGNYSEKDRPDPVDLYGYTKLLGEIDARHCVTLRTSLIGHELARRQSLVEWYLSQKGTVRGFRRAIFSGFTTIELARIAEMLLVKYPQAHGVWHVSSEAIDKYTLLNLVRKHYGCGPEIVPDTDFKCDRSLNSSAFRSRFGYEPPSWEAMIAEMSEMRSLYR